MHVELTEEQREVEKTARDFAREQIGPVAAELDEKAIFPREIVKQLGELGFMGIAVPESHGGAGMDNVCYVVAMEEISRGCASCGVIMSVNNSLACDPILHFGTEEQKKRWLTPMARGEILGCFGLTEPGAGSDAVAQKTNAVLDGDEWVLNGNKNFCTNGPEADLCVLFAKSEKEAKGSRSISAFIVPTDSKGFTRGEHDHKLGIKAAGSCSFYLEDCRIPKENLLGERGQGFKVAMHTLDGGRIGIAGQALGIARAALEDARDYSQEREQFGAPIAKLQAIQFMLADMATELEAARMLTYHAAILKDRGLRHSKESAMAKLIASRAAMRIADQGIQIHGGYGYIKEYPAERHLRDAKITEIYEGTSEIQRLVIAANLLKE